MSGTLDTKYLIIGNSAGGIGAAEAIRQVDRSGSITIVSDETYPAYSRPLISKFLAGEYKIDKMLFRPTDFYEKNSIRALPGKKSEESAIRLVSLDLDRVWTPMGGEPVIGRLGKPLPSQCELAVAGVM